MGQYYKIVNVSKRQYLHPHRFGDGLKLMEFAESGGGVMLGLAILLADGNNRGGGDLRSDDPIIGSWAGDRIVVTGDYADEGKFVDDDPGLAEQAAQFTAENGSRPNLYGLASEHFEDISDRVIQVIAKGEGERHPFARMDMSSNGWRDRPN